MNTSTVQSFSWRTIAVLLTMKNGYTDLHGQRWRLLIHADHATLLRLPNAETVCEVELYELFQNAPEDLREAGERFLRFLVHHGMRDGRDPWKRRRQMYRRMDQDPVKEEYKRRKEFVEVLLKYGIDPRTWKESVFG